jgi:hypothetical protein
VYVGHSVPHPFRRLRNGFLDERPECFQRRAHFAACPGLLSELARIIEQEQVCCTFLRFQISIEPGVDAITLEVTGPAGTREMLRDLGM